MIQRHNVGDTVHIKGVPYTIVKVIKHTRKFSRFSFMGYKYSYKLSDGTTVPYERFDRPTEYKRTYKRLVLDDEGECKIVKGTIVIPAYALGKRNGARKYIAHFLGCDIEEIDL